MSEWSTILLGVIAASTLVMALIQVGAIVYAARTARRVEALITKVEHDVRPLVERANQLGVDAARISGLAVGQVERADRLMGDMAQRVDTTLGIVQNAIVAPVREGAAVFGALRALLDTMRSFRRRPAGARGDEDDALFIG
ncbi:MAG: hypothetical protein GEV06_17430 [Luteitalea sp.]|nr:hypothetical protein [Luteitalea sp.]